MGSYKGGLYFWRNISSSAVHEESMCGDDQLYDLGFFKSNPGHHRGRSATVIISLDRMIGACVHWFPLQAISEHKLSFPGRSREALRFMRFFPLAGFH
jgi:hypothetical protein